ncbi:MAG: apolipoprotein N-acyltransferase [Elusimicrobia bacterium]|nr:apolipoprotein N-acyltransferase [Elusimicrobiota bacterium]
MSIADFPPCWLLACLAAWLLQAAVAARFLLRLRRDSTGTAPVPSVSVVVPCKGAGPGFDENILSFLRQDDAGRAEFVFVVPTPADPAHEALRRLLAAPGVSGAGVPPPQSTGSGLAAPGVSDASAARAKVVVSNAQPRRCSEKALNLLAGVESCARESEVLLFADSDARVRPDWLRLMAAPLRDASVGASTSAMLYLPAPGVSGAGVPLRSEREDGLPAPGVSNGLAGGRGLAGWLSLAWMAWGIPWLEPLGCVTGQSLALRRRDFDALSVRKLWEGTVSEDLALARRVRQAGLKVRFVAAAAPTGRPPASLPSMLALYNRWMTLFRVYDPRIWVPGLLLTAFKWAALCRVWHAPAAWPALAIAAADAATLAAVCAGLRRAAPSAWRGTSPLLAGLVAPLLWPVHAVNFAWSSLAGEIGWGGYTYAIASAADVAAIPGEEEAGRRMRRRLGLVGLLVAAGALYGAAYRPGCWGLGAWVAFVPLLWAAAGRPDGAAFRYGWLFGTAGYVVGGFWLAGSLQRFLGIPQPEPAAWFLFICCFHGLKWALACAAASWVGKGLSRRWNWDPEDGFAAAFVLSAVAAEGLFPAVIPSELVYSQSFHLPTVQSTEVFGMAAAAWLVLAFNAAVFSALRSWPRPGRQRHSPSAAGTLGLQPRPRLTARRAALAAAAAAAVLANEAWGTRRMAEVDGLVARRAALGESLAAGVIQGCLPLDPDQPVGEFSQDLPSHNRLSAQAAAAGAKDLIVWPESTYAGLVSYRDDDDPSPAVAGRPASDALAQDLGPGVPTLLSAIGQDASGASHNISLLVGPERQAWGLSEKSILVPFGEYMPGGPLLSWLRRLTPKTGGLSPGRGPKVLDLPGGGRLGVLVCYEDMLAGPAAGFAALGANLLVSQSNDTWFDRDLAPEHHLRTGLLRAVENRKFMLRANNTGVSAVVDPVGRVLQRVEAGRPGFLAARVALLEGRTKQITLRHMAYGLALALLAALALARWER